MSPVLGTPWMQIPTYSKMSSILCVTFVNIPKEICIQISPGVFLRFAHGKLLNY